MNKRVEEVNVELARGTPCRGIARQFAVSEDALNRHRVHMGAALAARRTDLVITRADGLATALADLFAQAQEIAASAKKGGDKRTALDAIGRLTKLLELGHRIATTPVPGGEWPAGVPHFERAADALEWVRSELIPQLEARAAQEALGVNATGDH